MYASLLINKFECIYVSHKSQQALLISYLHSLYDITHTFAVRCPFNCFGIPCSHFVLHLLVIFFDLEEFLYYPSQCKFNGNFLCYLHKVFKTLFLKVFVLFLNPRLIFSHFISLSSRSQFHLQLS